MFELNAWCVVVSLALAAGVWLDGRARQPLWRLPAAAWAVIVGLTWVGLLAYLVARWRPPAPPAVTGEASITIDASPGRLFAMVGDVTRMGEWSPETEGAEWLDGATGPAVGARFRGRNRRGRARWSTTCEVVEAETARVFAFAVGGAAKPETVWRYRFEPSGTGTAVTEYFELVKPLGPLSRLVTRLTTGVSDRRADLEEGARATLAALKAAAESPSGGDATVLPGTAGRPA